MGKIFGISDVRVTLFTPVWEPFKVPEHVNVGLPRRILGEVGTKHDLVVLQSKIRKPSFFNRVLNGFRKVV